MGAVTRALVLQEAADERKKARNRKLRDKKKKKKMAKKEAADVVGPPATCFWNVRSVVAGGVVVARCRHVWSRRRSVVVRF